MNASELSALNQKFAIPGIVEIVSGNGGLAKIRVTSFAASAEIYLQGAQVTSWSPAGADEILFLSAASHWQEGRAIRGGIPICFPWFRGKADDATAPAHGFVRTKEWRLDGLKADADFVHIVCSIESDEATKHWWPHDFRMQYSISIGKSLKLELSVTNTGTEDFRFEEALHTYFRVGDVSKVHVHGLDQVAYLDNADGNKEKVQSDDLSFRGKTDNAYLRVSGAADLIDPSLNHTLRTEKTDSSTTVVWNPGREGAAVLSDLGDDEWEQMACVEASNILESTISLGQGQTHTMQAHIQVISG